MTRTAWTAARIAQVRKAWNRGKELVGERMARVRVRTANMDFARGGDARYLRKVCRGADVVGVQEAKWTDLSKIAPKGWSALQDTSSEARAGSAILVRNTKIDVVWFRLRLGVDNNGVKMLPRWMAVAALRHRKTGRPFHVVSAHGPPKRYWWLKARYNQAIRRAIQNHDRTIVLIDANEDIRGLARFLGLDSYGEGIIGILTKLPVRRVRKHKRVSRWGMFRKLTDHPFVTATVALPKVKKRKP